MNRIAMVWSMAFLLLASQSFGAEEVNSTKDDGKNIQSALRTETIMKLGAANGTALACGEKETVTRIKKIVIANIPKTRVYGQAFEDSTNDAFIRVTSSTDSNPCDVVDSLSDTVDQIERDLPNLFPQDTNEEQNN